MNIAHIAAIITEDPDVFLDVLTEAPDDFYIPSFNKSQVPVPVAYPIDHHVIQQLGLSRGTRTTGWRITDPKTGTPRPLLLRDLPTEERLKIIHRVKAIVQPQFAKLEPYYMKQVTTGNLHLHKIEEDSERLNKTIALFIKLSRKAVWDGPTDIHKFTNWHTLEQKVNELADKFVDYDASEDSEILYTKQYSNNALSLILGGPPETTTYWFRAVTSPEAACKYGKGTTWCTSSTPAPRGTPEYDNHYAHQYHSRSGLYIVEIQTPTKPRRPILQISGDEFMDANDTPVSKLGPRLKDFLGNVVTHALHKLHPATAAVLSRFADADLYAAAKHIEERHPGVLSQQLTDRYIKELRNTINTFIGECQQTLNHVASYPAYTAEKGKQTIDGYYERKVNQLKNHIAHGTYSQFINLGIRGFNLPFNVEAAKQATLDAIEELTTIAIAATKELTHPTP